jgi:predicted transcriptional regulator
MKAENRAKAHKISISMDAETLAVVDEMAKADHRTRSGMIAFFLAKTVALRATQCKDCTPAPQAGTGE